MLHLDDLLERQYAQEHFPHGPSLPWNRLGKLSNPERILCAILVGEPLYYHNQKLSVTSYMKCLAYQGLRCHGIGCKSHTPIMTLESTQGGSVKIRAFVHNHGREVLITRDHDLARSLGGSNDISNIKPLCRECNNAKSAIETHLSNISKNFRQLKGDTVPTILNLVNWLLGALDTFAEKNVLCPSNAIIYLNNYALTEHHQPTQTMDWLFQSVGRHFGFSEVAFYHFMAEAPKAPESFHQDLFHAEGTPFNLSLRLYRFNQQKNKPPRGSFKKTKRYREVLLSQSRTSRTPVSS